jgi:hypothetical protein
MAEMPRMATMPEIEPSVGLNGPVALERRGTLFELEMIGGAFERRYRRTRPEVEAMPWGTLDLRGIGEADRLASRKAWTGAAFQEYRTAVACTVTLEALLACGAPIDLIALASRFPVDELVHVELCSRMAMEIGGGTEIRFDPDRLVLHADATRPPLVRAAEVVTRFFCVGEALSIPLIRGTWHASAHPLPKAVLGRIVRDEAAHGTFGFTFLDWAAPALGREDLAHVGRHADLAIGFIKKQWKRIAAAQRASFDARGNPLAWMETGAYLDLARRSMRDRVVAPLRARGIPIASWTPALHVSLPHDDGDPGTH